ncbi:DEKNAAC102731 [Brettanomyces naardenensis]|uniref:DEKNAAC102731 n=1 Tax=Brettanomyces naardenensis TaxID=13370 RepID=A0A448YKM0_BRENA|nr:DEKNAAC102731 [Brettanomyces naardenensis]
MYPNKEDEYSSKTNFDNVQSNVDCTYVRDTFVFGKYIVIVRYDRVQFFSREKGYGLVHELEGPIDRSGLLLKGNVFYIQQQHHCTRLFSLDLKEISASAAYPNLLCDHYPRFDCVLKDNKVGILAYEGDVKFNPDLVEVLIVPHASHTEPCSYTGGDGTYRTVLIDDLRVPQLMVVSVHFNDKGEMMQTMEKSLSFNDTQITGMFQVNDHIFAACGKCIYLIDINKLSKKHRRAHDSKATRILSMLKINSETILFCNDRHEYYLSNVHGKERNSYLGKYLAATKLLLVDRLTVLATSTTSDPILYRINLQKHKMKLVGCFSGNKFVPGGNRFCNQIKDVIFDRDRGIIVYGDSYCTNIVNHIKLSFNESDLAIPATCYVVGMLSTDLICLWDTVSGSYFLFGKAKTLTPLNFDSEILYISSDVVITDTSVGSIQVVNEKAIRGPFLSFPAGIQKFDVSLGFIIIYSNSSLHLLKLKGREIERLSHSSVLDAGIIKIFKVTQFAVHVLISIPKERKIIQLLQNLDGSSVRMYQYVVDSLPLSILPLSREEFVVSFISSKISIFEEEKEDPIESFQTRLEITNLAWLSDSLFVGFNTMISSVFHYEKGKSFYEQTLACTRDCSRLMFAGGHICFTSKGLVKQVDIVRRADTERFVLPLPCKSVLFLEGRLQDYVLLHLRNQIRIFDPATLEMIADYNFKNLQAVSTIAIPSCDIDALLRVGIIILLQEDNSAVAEVSLCTLNSDGTLRTHDTLTIQDSFCRLIKGSTSECFILGGHLKFTFAVCSGMKLRFSRTESDLLEAFYLRPFDRLQCVKKNTMGSSEACCPVPINEQVFVLSGSYIASVPRGTSFKLLCFTHNGKVLHNWHTIPCQQGELITNIVPLTARDWDWNSKKDNEPRWCFVVLTNIGRRVFYTCDDARKGNESSGQGINTEKAAVTNDLYKRPST